MLERLRDMNWAEIPQPAWNSPTEVPDALFAVSKIEGELNAERAYHRLLYAFGNNHCGSYYPVVLSAVPFLVEMLSQGNSLTRTTVLDVLLDLLYSFSPEPEFAIIELSPGFEVPLETALRDTIKALRPQIEGCATAADATSREGELVNELLSLLG
jgi:hypothetical protein